MDAVGYPAGSIFHFALWKVLDFHKEMQYNPYHPLDFESVKGMDGLGFLDKFSLSSMF